MNHFCRIENIKIHTILTAKEAYHIAKEYHKLYNIDGLIPEDINKAVYLDENNHITNEVTWMIRSYLEENTLEGMDELTIMVSDSSKQVSHVLDHNGIPVNNPKDDIYDNEELYKLFDDDEIL